MDSVVTRIPIRFESLDSYDDRFMKVKLWLCHTGENPNGSFFSKESIENAIPSLALTPILGFMSENSDGDDDFQGHKIGITKKDGKWTYTYQGHAYGVIPEDNNAQFEMRDDGSGVEKEYLTCEGLIWTKFDDAIDVMNRDEVKSQSMELADEYSGFFDKKTKLFNFSEFKFNGACILGKDTKPAMSGATIEINFSQSDVMDEIRTKLSEFKAIFSIQNPEGKGGNPVNEKLELLTKYSLTQEEVEAKGINFEESSLEDIDTFIASNFAINGIENQENVTENGEDNPSATKITNKTEKVDLNDDGSVSVNTNHSASTNFTLTSEQLEQELKLELSEQKITDQWGWSYQAFYFVDYMPEVSTVVAYNTDNGTLVGFNYTLTGDSVEIDFESAKRKKVQYVDMDIPNDGDGDDINFSLVSKEFHISKVDSVEAKVTEFEAIKDELTNTKTKFESLESEVSDLREFKINFEKSDRDSRIQELSQNFSSDLSEEEINTIFEQSTDLSVDDIELQLFALVGKKKKTNFSSNKSKEKTSVKVAFSAGGDSNKSQERPYQYLLDRVKGNK